MSTNSSTERQKHEDEDMETTLERARADAKQEFEAERDRILGALPAEYKSMFGEVAFSKWKNKWLPCLVLSPYMVPPGEVRNQWMGMFDKLSANDRMNQITYLVYWYGADPSQWYSFVKKSSLAKPEALEKKARNFNMNKPPKGLEAAYKEMAEDIPLQRHERKRGDVGFREGYELVDELDYHQVMSGEPSPTAESSIVFPSKKGAAKAASKKKGKKKHARSASPSDVKEEEEEDAKPSVPKRQKRTKQRNPPTSIDYSASSKESSVKIDVAVIAPAEREYKMCEMSYKQLVDNWQTAVDDGNLTLLLTLMEELNGAVGQFSPLFIERRNLSELMRRTVSLLDGGETDTEQAEIFADFRRKFKARYSRTSPIIREPQSETFAVGSEQSGGKGTVQQSSSDVDIKEESDDGAKDESDYEVKEESDKDEDFVPAPTAENVAPRKSKRTSKKTAKVAATTGKKAKTKNEKTQLGKKKPKFSSINKKFMLAWDTMISSDDITELRALLDTAIDLASTGRVTAEFIKDYQTDFKNLTKRSKTALKEKGHDVSVVKTLKSELTAVFTGEGKKRSPEGAAVKKPLLEEPKTEAQEDTSSAAVEVSTSNEPMVAQQKTTQIQKKKKRTIVSLGSILNAQATTKPAPSPKKVSMNTADDAPVSTSSASPKWYVTPCTITRQEEDPRSLGTEFLEQMVRGCLPDNPNHSSIAIQLEAAVFESCQVATALTPPPAEQYFERIHKTVAGCCGMKGPTELIVKLSTGEFATPLKFVEAALSLQ